jgi:DNA-binding transcriptional ArsR family regulator
MGNSRHLRRTSIAVDPDTGELLGDISLSNQPKVRYCFPGGFGFMGMPFVITLANVKLPADAYRLVFLLMHHSRHGNGMSWRPLQEYAVDLGVSPSRLSQLLKALEEKRLIKKLGGRAILLNPTFFFRGDAQEQTLAIDSWTEANKLYMVRKQA